MTAHSRLAKLERALAILQRCLGTKGVWADPTRYRDQCWTRDFGIAIAPLLHQLDEASTVRTHLENLSTLQRPNGQIPILFLDDEERWVREKEQKIREQGRPSFMLRRYREGELWNLTPGTRDSELVYLIAMYEYVKATWDQDFHEQHRHVMDAALTYIERELMRDGLVLGCDWRDTMEVELRDKPLLTNNCLMYRAYQLMGSAYRNKAEALRRKILRTHLTSDGRLCDFPGNDRFDPLGGALAVLCGVVSRQHQRKALVSSFEEVDTDYGVTIKCRHNPTSAEEREVIERTDGVVVWPFIVGFAVLALRELGEHGFADEQFAKLTALEGFREWYDPATGQGYGAQEQLWSATLYARALLT
jgi:hypothetical protein